MESDLSYFSDRRGEFFMAWPSSDLAVSIQQENVILGYFNNPLKVALNFCILYGKYFIYCQRYGSNNPSFLGFLFSLKRKISVYKHISTVNGKMSQFNKHWNALSIAIASKLATIL